MIQNEAIIDLQVQNDNKTATTKTTQQKQSRKHFTYAQNNQGRINKNTIIIGQFK